MTYADGFVAAVPTANKTRYIEHAESAAAIFEEYGAPRSVERRGDGVPDGKITSFPLTARRRDDETVVLSWVLWPSRDARDAATEKIMADERLDPDRNPMPFDGMRLICGGFEMVVDA